jgi:hypothetical protein
MPRKLRNSSVTTKNFHTGIMTSSHKILDVTSSIKQTVFSYCNNICMNSTLCSMLPVSVVSMVLFLHS